MKKISETINVDIFMEQVNIDFIDEKGGYCHFSLVKKELDSIYKFVNKKLTVQEVEERANEIKDKESEEYTELLRLCIEQDVNVDGKLLGEVEQEKVHIINAAMTSCFKVYRSLGKTPLQEYYIFEKCYAAAFDIVSTRLKDAHVSLKIELASLALEQLVSRIK